MFGFWKKVEVDIPDGKGGRRKVRVSRKQLDTWTAEGRLKNVEGCKAHISDPVRGELVEYWIVGRELVSEQYDQFKDENGDVYVSVVYEAGQPQTNLVKKEMWDLIKKETWDQVSKLDGQIQMELPGDVPPDRQELNGDSYDKKDRLGRPFPPEYDSWFDDIFPFMNTSMEGIDRQELNGDSYDKIRLLFGFYFLGVAKYYAGTKTLTYGQERHLFIEALIRLGWTADSATSIFDLSNDPPKYLPELADDVSDAIDVGKRASRAFFEYGDLRAYLMPEVRLLKWKEKFL